MVNFSSNSSSFLVITTALTILCFWSNDWSCFYKNLYIVRTQVPSHKEWVTVCVCACLAEKVSWITFGKQEKTLLSISYSWKNYVGFIQQVITFIILPTTVCKVNPEIMLELLTLENENRWGPRNRYQSLDEDTEFLHLSCWHFRKLS